MAETGGIFLEAVKTSWVVKTQWPVPQETVLRDLASRTAEPLADEAIPSSSVSSSSDYVGAWEAPWDLLCVTFCGHHLEVKRARAPL